MKQKNVTKLLKRYLSKALSIAMALTLLPAEPIFAAGTSPIQAGSTQPTPVAPATSQPFEKGTGGSDNFGRPTLVVRQVVKNTAGAKPSSGITKDLLIAAAEARYGQTIASRGQDIMVSTSEDGGETWAYSYPLKFEDSKLTKPGAATINNPILADVETISNEFVSGGTTYLFVNVSPGTVLDAAGMKTGTGYYTVGEGQAAVSRLALTKDASKVTNNPAKIPADYPYYIGELVGGYAPILNKADGSDTNDAVDAYFNLYTRANANADYTPLTQKQLDTDADVQQNVFYKDSKYHVYNANYIMCITSSDKCATWNAPEILNAEIMRDENEFLYISDGQGLKTSLNRLLIPLTTRSSASSVSVSKATLISKDVDPNRLASNPDSKWVRSAADFDLTETEGMEEESEKWASGGGLIELIDGNVRMFLRNGTGSVCYVDINRGEDDTFGSSQTPQTPVMSNTVSTDDARVSAISYSKNINGKKAILATFPTGSEHTHGIIGVFQRTGGTQHPILEEIDEYNIESPYFSSACLDEFDYGNKIALIYQSSTKTVFQTVQMWDVVERSKSFIEGVEYDLNLDVGGTTSYERQYHIIGDSNIQTTTPTSPMVNGQPLVDISFTKGSETKETVPALYSAKKIANSTLLDIFGTEPDTSIDISKAEFTILKESNLPGHENHYSIYSEGARRYLTIDPSSADHFTRTNRNYVSLKKKDGTDTFYVYRDVVKDGADKVRMLLLNMNSRTADQANYDSLGDVNNFISGFMLLEKRQEGDTTGTESDLIPGYKQVSEITSGEKYLIAAETNSDSSGQYNDTAKKVMIFYPENGKQHMFKMVYKTRERTIDALKTLTIAPKGIEGQGDLTVNNITYHIDVSLQTINIPQGGSTFVQTDKADNTFSIANTNVVTAANSQQEKAVLYKFVTKVNRSMDGFSALEPNMNFTDAEFVFTKNEDGRYLICAKGVDDGRDLYLTNRHANTYFESSPIPQDLDKLDGVDSFEIRRYAPNNYDGRWAYFYYEGGMVFDGVDRRVDGDRVFADLGDFGFELLEKKDTPISNTDPIPGYIRVGEITEGKQYLITQYFGGTENHPEGIFVLYPQNQKELQTKLYRTISIPGVLITAAPGVALNAKTTMTLNGASYTVKISTACQHPEESRRIEGASLPTCTAQGATGIEYCTVCGQPLTESTAIPALGHDFGDAAFTPDPNDLPTYDPVTKETHDGSKIRPCTRSECNEVERQAYPASELVASDLQTKLSTAKAIDQSTLAPESATALTAAIAAAEANPTQIADQIDAITGLENAINNKILLTAYTTRKNQLNTLISQKKAEIERTSYYTPESIQALQTELNKLTEAAINAMTYAELETAKTTLNGVELVKSQTAEDCEELQTQLNEECTKLADIIAAGNADKKYTDESWNRLMTAYEAINNKSIDELIALGTDKLAAYLADLKADLVETKPNDGPGDSDKPGPGTPDKNALSAGVPYTVGGITYQISGNAANKEVVITKGANTKNVNIASTVTINGQSCKIVAIGNNAFKGLASVKKVVIGDNVTTIGSSAFANCKSLTAVTIGNSVKTINAKAFMGCKKLKKVTLKGKNAISIKKQAFKNTAKKATIKWPKGIKKATKNKLKKAFKKAKLNVK